MVNTLLIIILVLVILLVCITILFHRQGMRLNEEIKHAVESEDIKSHYLADASQTLRGPIDSIIQRCEDVEVMPCFHEHPEIAEAIGDIRFQSKQLLQYTKEILEISNTEGNIPTLPRLRSTSSNSSYPIVARYYTMLRTMYWSMSKPRCLHIPRYGSTPRYSASSSCISCAQRPRIPRRVTSTFAMPPKRKASVSG